MLGRKIYLSSLSSAEPFSIGNRVKITNDLYKTLHGSTTKKDYQGRVINIMPCTVLIKTDSGMQIRKYFNNVIKIQQYE